MRADDRQPHFELACNLDAITPEQRGRYDLIRAWMKENVRSVVEYPEGYICHYDDAPSTVMRLAEFITLERLCCPFLRFALEWSPGSDQVVLSMGGSTEVKDYLAGVFTLSSG